jgi:glycosyltransferase involved in cell wall biosynthesis
MEVWILPDASWVNQDTLPAFPPVGRDQDAVRVTLKALDDWVQKDKPPAAVSTAPVRIHVPFRLWDHRLIRLLRKQQPQADFVFYTAQLSKHLPLQEGGDRLCVPSFYLRNQYRKRNELSKNAIRICHPAVSAETPHRWSEEGLRVRKDVRRERGWQKRNVLVVDVSQATKVQRSFLEKELSVSRNQHPSLVVYTWFRPVPFGKRCPLYLAADWLLTASSSTRSLSPIHAEAMVTGLPVVTFDLGDHGEWVRHAHNGLVLHLAQWRAEWRRYLAELLSDPSWSRDLGKNARAIAERYLMTKTEGGA